MELKEITNSSGQVEIVKRIGGMYETHHSMKYKIVLEWNDDVQEVIAIYMNYKDEVIDYNDLIIFKVGDSEVSIQSVNGSASCPVLIEEPGEYEIITVNDGVDNGRVMIIG